MKDCPKGAAILLLNDNLSLLLLKRRSVAFWMPNKWGLPGGIVEEGEHCVDAALRETLEEAALEVTNPRLLSINEHVAIYFATKYTGEVKIDFEHTDWAWVSREELGKYDTVPEINTLYELAVMHERQNRNR